MAGYVVVDSPVIPVQFSLLCFSHRSDGRMISSIDALLCCMKALLQQRFHIVAPYRMASLEGYGALQIEVGTVCCCLRSRIRDIPLKVSIMVYIEMSVRRERERERERERRGKKNNQHLQSLSNLHSIVWSDTQLLGCNF